ncbi:MAG: hypothetical protein HY720_27260 [Planctomycetes bacterium]|nr:hypothetical protein [Planctomycetota bacterium]
MKPLAKKLVFLEILVLAGIGVAIWYFARTPEEEKLRARVEEFAGLLAKGDREKAVEELVYEGDRDRVGLEVAYVRAFFAEFDGRDPEPPPGGAPPEGWPWSGDDFKGKIERMLILDRLKKESPWKYSLVQIIRNLESPALTEEALEKGEGKQATKELGRAFLVRYLEEILRGFDRDSLEVFEIGSPEEDKGEKKALRARVRLGDDKKSLGLDFHQRRIHFRGDWLWYYDPADWFAADAPPPR